MKILFSVRNSAYVRHYEAVIRMLAAGGHRVALVVDGGEKVRPWPAHVAQLAQDCPGVQLGRTPTISLDPWYELATAVRQNLFQARVLESDYADMPILLSRAAEKAPGFARGLIEAPLGRSGLGRRAITRALGLVERSTPIPAAVLDFLHQESPDVVVLTPLVVLRTAQFDLLRAARTLGIPTVWAVASWDHLSSKGLLHACPDRVVVWNDVQRDEAIRLHGVPADRIVVSGAQVFDEWFDRRPSVDRDTFCRRVGLQPEHPYVLYAGSALFEGSPSEAGFARSWMAAVRGRPGLQQAGLLFRPHFKRGTDWQTLDLRNDVNAVVWPPAGEAPVDAGSRESYFDSMHYASAVVGLNTSALIEAAVVGRPVLTVLPPEFYGNQEGTVHFRYLTRGSTPLLHTARDLDAHAAALELVVSGRDPDPGRSARFVRRFVRPGPLDVPATELVVTAIEQAAALHPTPEPVRAAVPEWVLRRLAGTAVRRMQRQREMLRRIDQEKRDRRLRERESERAQRSARRALDASK